MQKISFSIPSFTHQFRLAVLCLYLLCVFIRVLAVQNGNFPFWFDSGRDAVISQEIYQNHDIKIQGPTASGTNDTIFHGVIYFYLVGAVYRIVAGDPQQVLYLLIFFSSLAVIPVAYLGKSLSGSARTGLLAGLLYCFSYDAVRSGTWVSNPIMAAVGIPLFFWLLWLVFFEKKVQLFPVLTLALALCQQSIVFMFVLWGVVFSCVYFQHTDKSFAKLWTKKSIALGISTYLIGISSMIVAQAKAWHDGIFSLSKLLEFSSSGGHDFSSITGLATLLLTKLTQGFFPTFPILSILTACLVGYLWIKKTSVQHSVWLLLALTSPLWLLAWHYRKMYHGFIGIEAIILIPFAWVLSQWAWPKYLGKFVVSAALLLFVYSNFQMWKIESQQRVSLYFVPEGAFFNEQLQAIDYTYKLAEGKPFTISSFTNPYGYNTLWAYLYSWYGQKKYGYTPSFLGPDQTGIFGGSLLTRTETPGSIHFAIREPGPGLPEVWQTIFAGEQVAKVGTPSASEKFGTLFVDVTPPENYRTTK